MNEATYDVAIVGGGPAGSTAALYLARNNFHVCVIEKSSFPRETLCGEFLSREVLQLLEELDLSEAFHSLGPNALTSLRFCPATTRSFSTGLPFVAYGLKRGTFDSFLLEQASNAGAVIVQPKTVEAIHRVEGVYRVALKGGESLITRRVILAHGKSSTLDKSLHRTPPTRRSRLNGVKFHIPKKYLPHVPSNEIQLYTGRNMYCGVNVVNDETVTLCFLEERFPDDVQPRARIIELIKANRSFAQLCSGGFESRLSSFPIYGVGGIDFGRKKLVDGGVFSVGDAAQVIAPLAGDGIGMAMESAKILSRLFEEGREKGVGDKVMGEWYADRWRSAFQRRLAVARGVQTLLLSRAGSRISDAALSMVPSLLVRAVRYTRS